MTEIHQYFGDFSSCNKVQKRVCQLIKFQEKETKLLFADDVILCLGNTND